jgi:hypothetical protein
MTAPHTTTRFSLGLAAVGLALVLAVGGCTAESDPAEGSDAAAVTAPVLRDPAATATELVTTWLETLQAGESVADLLAPNFQIQRADGSSADRDGYLAKPATVSEFTLGDNVEARQSGNTLSVRWSMKVTEVIEGVEYVDVVAPRLTVFEWTGAAWQIVGYGNFNPSR